MGDGPLAEQLDSAPGAEGSGDPSKLATPLLDRQRRSDTLAAPPVLPPAGVSFRGNALLALAALALGAICWFDYITGPDIGFSLFYLLPVLACAWWAGRTRGMVSAVIASIAWFAADFASFGHSLAVTTWNGFTRLVIFTSMAWMTWKLRRDREQLSEMIRIQAVLARTDWLTGLPNSMAFMETVTALLAQARQAQRTALVAYVDLDNFKRVNDRLGHAAGDAVLGRLARALRDLLRPDDVAARLGGDEFALLLLDLSPADAEYLLARLVDGIAEIARDYPGTGLGLSIGAAHFTEPPGDIEVALRLADELMYEVKALGKGSVLLRKVPGTDRSRLPEGGADERALRPGGG